MAIIKRSCSEIDPMCGFVQLTNSQQNHLNTSITDSNISNDFVFGSHEVNFRL